ncbi:Protein kinase domain [Trypanosoma vivax]|nr:putative protein kinase [Trypanosoma vivax]KAH8608909.1 Protein kinase domain [Trypanosoma vivax]
MITQGLIVGDHYSIVKLLGEGAFGCAFLVKHTKDGSEYVLKCARTARDDDLLLLEAQNMLITTSDHVLRCFRVWNEPQLNRCCILLEYCDGGDLEEYLSSHFPLPETELISMFVQLLLGLDHIHLKHLMHRDIKLQNLMLQRNTGSVKIGDFGLSKSLSFTDEVSCTRLGTPMYFSPEVLKGLEYTRKTDVWSMGVAFYRLMTNEVPFPASSAEELHKSFHTKRAVHPCRVMVNYSEALGDMVLQMLTKSRTKRPGVRELLALPIFTPVLTQWPWRPPCFKGTKCLFLCRPKAAVNIRSKPSLVAERIGEVTYGDHIFVSDEQVNCENFAWHRVIHPLNGYCIAATAEGQYLFQGVNDPARCHPILPSS